MKVKVNRAVEILLARGNLPLLYWLKKDILEVPVDRDSRNLCKYAARIRIEESQRPDGSWFERKKESRGLWEKTYCIVDTLKNLISLHDYSCTLKEEVVQKGIDFLFSTQTREGDFRGAYLNEYAPIYHSLSLEILCRYGLDKDKKVQKGFRWIIRNRQNDSGWAIPYRTVGEEELKGRYHRANAKAADPIQPDKTQPFSHLVTGMVLRAFAESPTWRKKKEVWQVGRMLLNRFFLEDKYEDRRFSLHWEELSYPFWSTNILNSLDSLSKIGFSPEEEKVKEALEWLLQKQNSQGFWESASRKTALEDHLWVTLAVLRVLKRFGLLDD